MGVKDEQEVKQSINLNIPIGWKVWDGDRYNDKLPENAYYMGIISKKWKQSTLSGCVIGSSGTYIVPNYYNPYKFRTPVPTGFRYCLVSEKRVDATHFYDKFNHCWDKMVDSNFGAFFDPDTYITDKPLPDPNS